MKTVAETDDEAFAGASSHKLEVELLEEDYLRGERLIAEGKMAADEGWRQIVDNGLAYLEGQREMDKLNRPDVPLDVTTEVNKLAAQALYLNGQYAAMKFKAFRFMQNSRVLEMNVAGLRGEMALTEHTIPRLRGQVNELKAENEALRARLVQYEPGEGLAPACTSTATAQENVTASQPFTLRERIFGRR